MSNTPRVERSANVHPSIPRHPAAAFQLEDGEVVVLPALVVELPDGATGHYQRTFGDCLRCAVATCLQVAYESVDIPDDTTNAPAELQGFARHLNLELRAHPVDEPPDHPWIAISHLFEHGGEQLRHVYVMNGTEPYFNPWNFRRLDGSVYGAAGDTAAETGFSFHERTH